MKNKMFLAAIMLLAASCSNEESLDSSVNPNEQGFAPVTVRVDGFAVSQSDFSDTGNSQGARATTRATAVASYSGVSFITLAFYASNGIEVYKHTQEKGNLEEGKTFGEFECSLPMDTYTMVVVAYTAKEGSPFVLTSPTEAAFTGLHAYETFAYTQAVNISNTAAVDISATLNRVVSMLTVISTDGKTADVSNVRMTFSAGGKDFNPTTGLAITNTGFVNTVGNSATVGNTSTSSTALFLATDEQTMDVTIETLNTEGAVLFSKTVTNVPFKRNRKTKLTGAMYTNEALSGSFQVETAWLTDHNAEF